MDKIAELNAAIPNLKPNDASFAHSLLSHYARYGSWSVKQAPGVDKLLERAKNGGQPAAATAVGQVTGILKLFEQAKRHLKFPAVELGIPALGNDVAMRLNIAGDRAKVPGSLTVVDANKDPNTGRRAWLGRITLDGQFQPSDRGSNPAIAKRLAEFAADPARVAAEHGRLTGRCCFCRLPLSDPRSTAVGYGKICAEHFGLTWGTEVHNFSTN